MDTHFNLVNGRQIYKFNIKPYNCHCWDHHFLIKILPVVFVFLLSLFPFFFCICEK
jgi:hypothetical protein